MSYDIYGEPLRRGHCEVHPHVHEEYPCSVCIQENKNRNSQQQSECDYYKIASLEHGLELSQQRIAELEQRNDELAATVERLREAGTKLRDDIDLSKIVGAGKRNFANEWDAAVSSTPQQNLNAVKREVYADGFYQGFSDAWCSNFDWEQDHVNYGLEQSEIRAEQEYPSVKDGE